MSDSSTNYGDLLKRALVKLDVLQTRLDAVERPLSEPIAVIGLACRFPGRANDPESFWRLLSEGVDATGDVPADRWDVDAYYDPRPATPGKMYTRRGAFVEGLGDFDPAFFGISPREALSMDPQQRMLLQVAWEAIEHAGLAPSSLVGSPTGVFVGISCWDYSQLHVQAGQPADTYSATGNAHSVAAGRLSYLLDLRGPSIAIDTACSSSLVALHLASQSLRMGESRMALVGGANVVIAPDSTVATCQARMMAADGRCKTFDASADGYVRGEGCGVLVLKRLSDATADGDRVLALIRGTAVNQDGRSAGITAPNGAAQEAAIREALGRAGIRGHEVDYVEAHGTGTSLGDPIEVRALGAVLGRDRSADRPLLVGSVKTNIGHLESAAGVAALIKVVLALGHEEIPPHLHFRTPNPLIPWGELPMKVVTERTSWMRGSRRRLASVSSFGFSGTNAHAIVEEAPLSPEFVQPAVERTLHVVALSAKRPEALEELASRYHEHLQPEVALPDVAFTANTGRAHHPERLAIVAANTRDLLDKLEAVAAGREAPGVLRGSGADSGRPQVAFLFTGQGSQYVGMGRCLFETQPTFRRLLLRCDEILQPLLSRPLLSVLFGEGGEVGALDQTGFTQPALFALEYSLAELWRSWGVEPAMVMGHSVGEYVAACVAGACSLEDGLRLIAERARLMQSLPAGGAMAAIFANESHVTEVIAPHSRSVSIAAVNGPESTVISGDVDAVREALAEFDKIGIRSQALSVSHAFHSPLMEPILDALELAVGRVSFAEPRTALVSNLTGGVAGLDDLGRPAYWRRHAREKVRFAAGMETLRAQRCDVFIEVGPHPTLLGMGARCLPEGYGQWLPSLRRGRDDWDQMLTTLASLYVRGGDVEWAGFERDYSRRRVALPTYPFLRERFWSEGADRGARTVVAVSAPKTPAVHPLLGQRLRSAHRDVQYESALSRTRPSFLMDHGFFGRTVFPGAGYVEMALAALSATPDSPATIEDLLIEQPLFLPEGEAQAVQFLITPAGQFEVFSSHDEAGPERWRRHAAGQVRPDQGSTESSEAFEAIRARCLDAYDPAAYYQMCRSRGVEYGPAFQPITALWGGEGEALAHARLPEALLADFLRYRFHPVLLDAGFQLLGAAIGRARDDNRDVYMPTRIARLRVEATVPSAVWIHAALAPGGKDRKTLSAVVTFYSEDGKVMARLDGLHLRQVTRAMLATSGPHAVTDWMYEVSWEEAPSSEQAPSPRPGRWLILADTGGFGRRVASTLESRGESVLLATAAPSFGPQRDGHWEVDPSRPAEFVAFVESALSAEVGCRGIVYLWGLDAGEGTGVGPVEASRTPLSGALLVAQAAARQATPEGAPLWLVTRGAQSVRQYEPVSLPQTALWGMGRTAALEIPNVRWRRVDLEAGASGAEELLSELSRPDSEDEIAYRGGRRLAARLVRAKAVQGGIPEAAEGHGLQLQIPVRGVLDNLAILPVSRRPPGRGEVEIEVAASGLNFRDVLNALGMYPGDPGPLGGECVGKIASVGPDVSDLHVGDEVIGLASGSFGTHVTTFRSLVAIRPRNLSLEEAATIPMVFLTAHYALDRLGRLRAGERVLIHAGAGGVGMAAIQIAQRAGAEVFATAGSAGKRDLLRSLGVPHVMDSRSLAFHDEIQTVTHGEGIDLVLNSLTGDFIPMSLSLLRPGGRFLEIGKRGIWDPEQIRQAKADVEYHVIYLGELMETAPASVQEMLSALVDEFAAGHLQPLPRTVFSLRHAADAFRHMAQAKHVGKVVLRQDLASGPIKPDGTYLVTGGLGGLGLVVARTLVEHGARHLALLGRRAPTPEASSALAALEDLGARITVLRADVSVQEDVARALTEIKSSMPPLRGVVHAAGVLDDGVISQQTWERCARVLAPKATGAWLLHEQTRGEAIDFFVLFSSLAGLLGSPGQGNYAAANAFLDGLAHQRRSEGLPALSIDWGPWAEVGMAAGLGERDDRRRAESGVELIAPDDGGRALALVLGAAGTAQIAIAPIHWERFLEASAGGRQQFFRAFSRAATGAPDAGPAFVRRLAELPLAQRRDDIVAHVRQTVLKVLGLSATHTLGLRRPLTEMGLDSLMAVELRNALSASFGTTLPASLPFDYPTVEELSDHLVDLMGPTVPPSAGAPEHRDVDAAGAEDLLARLPELPDSDVDALLRDLSSRPEEGR